MRRYGIRRYLTDEQKARAVAAEYVPTPMDAGGMQWRTTDDRCPLGVAIGGQATETPDPREVEYLLSKSGESASVYLAALHFIRAWEHGRIPPDQLAAALGVDA